MASTFFTVAPLLVAICAAQTPPGTITTIAGTGARAYNGDNQPAISAALNAPVHITPHPSGDIYITDSMNHLIRRVDTAGTITTYAGNRIRGYSGDSGAATSAALNTPSGTCFDRAGNLYIADTGNLRLRKVDTRTGNIGTVAGNGMPGGGGDGQAAINASLANPVRCVVDSLGNIYIADQGANRVRKVDTQGIISTFAGTGSPLFSGDNGPAKNAALNSPADVALNSKGELYISDQGNNRIRKVAIDGTITTEAGTGQPGFSGDGGMPLAAAITQPGGLTVDGFDGVFFVDASNRVRHFKPGDVIVTVAGTGTLGVLGDNGPATAAALRSPSGIETDGTGALVIADTGNNRVRKVVQVGRVPFFAAGSITNAASFATGASPGAIATLFGSNLTNASGIVAPGVLPIPVSVAGTSVMVSGVPAPIFAVASINGQQQINFQVPYEVAGQGVVPVIVNNNGSVSAPILLSVTDVQPGIFLAGQGIAALLHGGSNALVTAANPARKEEVVILFATGLGLVSPSPGTGNAAAGLASTTVTPIVTIAGIQASISYSGLAPGFVGLYQVNFTVPPNAPSGSPGLVISSGGALSNLVAIPVE